MTPGWENVRLGMMQTRHDKYSPRTNAAIIITLATAGCLLVFVGVSWLFQ
jgi:hypothetical protein